MAPYGRLLEWYRDANKSRILAQALILSPDRVPRSLVVSRGTMIGGMGRSWSVPVYILNGNFPDAFPADEDPVPFDGEPHPEHGPVVLGHNPLEPNWQNEQQGAANNLGFFGGNPRPGSAHHLFQHNVPKQNPQANLNGAEPMEDDQADDEWPAWNPAVFAADNVQQVPQHLGHPQDHLDLNLSGSSMRFLRGDGPDIWLERVFQEIAAQDDSSSSSDATSVPGEDRARFAAAQSRCANVLIFGRKGMPADVFTRASTSTAQPEPITIDKERYQSALTVIPAPASTGLEIVPWKPVPHVIALQLLPAIIDSRRAAETQARSEPVIFLGDVPQKQQHDPEGSGKCGPED